MRMKIALQLYSIREMAKEGGLERLLAEAKKSGYDGVEFAGFYDHSAEAVKSLLNKYGLKGAGAHVGYKLLCENPEKILADAETIGLYSVVVPYYNAEDEAGWAEFCRNMERFGEMFAKKGIRFGYHNHANEFGKIGDEYIIDYIFKNTSSNVQFEMDTFWVIRGKEDPVAYAKKYADRMEIFHAKDIDDADEDIEVGCGRVDFPAVISSIQKLDWIVVEQEAFKMSMDESIRIGCDNLKKMIG